MDEIVRDVRYAFRSLFRSRGFAAAAIVALGLGTGAATAVFSLLDGVVLRPLPYREPGRLVMLWETNREQGLTHERLSPVNLMDYRELDGSFEDVAAWWIPELNLVDETGEPIRVPSVEASENFFDVLGVQPTLGRGFPRDETLHGSDLEAVISHRLWQSRFSSDPSAIGRTVRLNGFVYTIVGVMPAGFHFPDATDLWQRLRWDMRRHSRGAHFMEAAARLQPGTTVERANAELAALTARLGAEFAPVRGWGARVEPLAMEVAGVFRPGLFALLGGAGLLLLIACINIANLLLARATARRTEVAVRAAIGAGRARLVRQFLTESLVLALLGSLLGLIVAYAGVRGFLAWTPIEIPRADEISVNLSVLAFAAGIGIFTAACFGLAPALLQSRVDLQETLREAARGTAGGARWARNLLVVGQVALAVMLLSGAGLLVRSVAELLNEDTGVTVRTALTTDIQLSDVDYDDWSRAGAFFAQLLENLRARPGIETAGASNFPPLELGWRLPYAVQGDPPAPESEAPQAQAHTVDEQYFEALGVRLMDGRYFDARDDASRPSVVIVNEAFVDRAFRDRPAVGAHLLIAARQIGPLGARLTEGDVHEVVGVVANVKNTSLREQAEPAVYFTVRQFPFRKMHLAVAGPAAPAALLAAIREEVRRLDPSVPLGEVRTMDRLLARAADPPRFVMLVMSVFAALALLLAAVGIYGVLSYVVNRRRREIGIRMALGARPRDVLSSVLLEGFGLALAGAGAGIAAAAVGARLLGGLLYGVRPADPISLGAALAMVLAVTLAACILPGLRAARTEPMRTLRSDG